MTNIPPKRNHAATVGLALGIISVFLFEIGVIPLASILVSVVGIRVAKREQGRGSRAAWAGCILGSVYFLMNLNYWGHLGTPIHRSRSKAHVPTGATAIGETREQPRKQGLASNLENIATPSPSPESGGSHERRPKANNATLQIALKASELELAAVKAEVRREEAKCLNSTDIRSCLEAAKWERRLKRETMSHDASWNDKAQFYARVMQDYPNLWQASNWTFEQHVDTAVAIDDNIRNSPRQKH